MQQLAKLLHLCVPNIKLHLSILVIVSNLQLSFVNAGMKRKDLGSKRDGEKRDLQQYVFEWVILVQVGGVCSQWDGGKYRGGVTASEPIRCLGGSAHLRSSGLAHSSEPARQSPVIAP